MRKPDDMTNAQAVEMMWQLVDAQRKDLEAEPCAGLNTHGYPQITREQYNEYKGVMGMLGMVKHFEHRINGREEKPVEYYIWNQLKPYIVAEKKRREGKMPVKKKPLPAPSPFGYSMTVGQAMGMFYM